MARYIDADAFAKNMSEIKESVLQNHSLKRGNEPIDGYDADFLRSIGFAKQLLDEFPTADVRPNVRGAWVKSETEEGLWVCSNCTFGIGAWGFSYCPNCGADMRKKGEE